MNTLALLLPSLASLLGYFDVRRHGAKGNGTTDDTAAIQAAIDAAAAAGGGTVYFPAGIYQIDGPVRTTIMGGILSPGGQLVLPLVSLNGGAQVPIRLLGPVPPGVTGSVIGAIVTPSRGVAILRSAAASGAILVAPQSTSGYEFTMVNCTIENLIFRTYDNPQMSAIDLGYSAAAQVRNVVCDTGLYDIDALTSPDNASAAGVILPRVNNGAFSQVDSIYVMGYRTGLVIAEHTSGTYVSVAGCYYGLIVGSAQNHAAFISRYLDTHNTYGIYASTSGIVRLDVAQWAIERRGTGWNARVNDVQDSANGLKGQARYAVVVPNTGAAATFTKLGGVNFICTDMGE